MANFTLTAGADLWQPGVARDVLTGSFANLSSADVIDLGAGLEEDVFVLTSAGVFDTRAGGNAANIIGYERLNLAAGSSTVILTHALVMAAYADTVRAGQFAVLGNGGSDTIDASLVGATGRITLVAGGGNDTFLGGAGNDLVRFNAIELTASDSINAGAGFDTLRLDTAGALAADALANVRRIETIELATGGSSVSIAQAMAASADGGVLAVVARGGANAVDASAATTAVNYFAGAGADSYVGGTGADRVHVTPSTLTSADSFQGGGGASVDMIRITAPGTFAASAFDGVRGFERIYTSAGGNVIVLPSSITNGVVGTLGVNGGSGNDLLDARALALGLWFDPGAGSDIFRGGLGNDTLVLDPANGDAGDEFDGGAGFDRINFIAGGVLPIPTGSFIGFEEVRLNPAGNTISKLNAVGGYHVVGSAASDTVDMPSNSSAALAEGDDRLVLEFFSAPTVDAGAGVDTIVLVNGFGGGQTFDITGALTGFERVMLDFPASFAPLVRFLGPGQAWDMEGTNGPEVVQTGAGTYDLRLLGGADEYEVLGGSFVRATDSGASDSDRLMIAAAASGAVVSANLGGGADAYTVRGGSQVLITDSVGNDVLQADVVTAGTQLVAQFGEGTNIAVLASRPGWYVDLGGGNDSAALNPGVAPGMLLRGGAGTDELQLVGAGWGAVSVNLDAVDQLITAADGGAVQMEFERLNLAAATNATVRAETLPGGVLTAGNDLVIVDRSGLVTLDGGAGIDTLQLESPVPATFEGRRLLNFEFILGSAGADLIDGTDGNETIHAGEGDDLVSSSPGSDVITLGGGADRIGFTRETGSDTITDFAPGVDTIVFLSSSFALAAGSGGLVALDNGVLIAPNVGMVLFNVPLGSAAVLDAVLAARSGAPNGGILAAAATSAGGPVAIYYDPNARLTGGANAPELVATLTGVTAASLLLPALDIF